MLQAAKDKKPSCYCNILFHCGRASIVVGVGIWGHRFPELLQILKIQGGSPLVDSTYLCFELLMLKHPPTTSAFHRPESRALHQLLPAADPRDPLGPAATHRIALKCEAWKRAAADGRPRSGRTTAPRGPRGTRSGAWWSGAWQEKEV